MENSMLDNIFELKYSARTSILKCLKVINIFPRL